MPENVRTDVWLSGGGDQSARNLTDGQTDGTGAWAPMWSPDGAHLAFLSTRGGEGRVALWMWVRESNQLRRIDTPGVKEGRTDPSCRWVDARRVLCLVASAGGSGPAETEQGRYARMKAAAWGRAARGELTAEVLTSSQFQTSTLALWLVDIQTGAGKEVALTKPAPAVSFHTSWLAPDGRALAFATPIASDYNHESAMRMGVPISLGVVSLTDSPLHLKQALPENVHSSTLKWSTDGKELAFFANGPGPVDPILLYGVPAAAAMPVERVPRRGNPARFYRLDIVSGTLAEWGTGDIDLGMLGSPEFFWTSTGDVIVSAPRREFGVANGPPPSRGAPWGANTSNAIPIYPPAPTIWWVLDRSGRTHPLAPEGTALPRSLQPIDEGRAFIGLRDGEVWSVDPKTGTVTNLTASFEPPVSAIFRVVETSVGTQVLIRARISPSDTNGPSSLRRGSANENDYRIDVRMRAISQMRRPTPLARLTAYAPVTKSATYVRNDMDGLFVWRTGRGGDVPKIIVETNTDLRAVETAQTRTISYTSLNGETLNASLWLPRNFQEGRRYPVVLDVRYGDNIARRDNPDARPTRLGDGDIFAAAGYLFLMPSIPESLPGTLPEEGDSPFMALSGIVPAVDKAISLGLADPERLFIRGASRGGWTVLATIGVTARFTAAVSDCYGEGGWMGAVDHNTTNQFRELGEMGTIDPNGGISKPYRPSDVPWWRDGDWYRRSHPLSYVDRVKTPTLIMHGDADVNTPIDASEDYFFALVSMRKPAELVRYMGEGHSRRIPANVRDGFRREFAWFDRWGDISRDASGDMIFEGDRVKSRNGVPPLTPDDFARIGPAASTNSSVNPSSR